VGVQQLEYKIQLEEVFSLSSRAFRSLKNVVVLGQTLLCEEKWERRKFGGCFFIMLC